MNTNPILAMEYFIRQDDMPLSVAFIQTSRRGYHLVHCVFFFVGGVGGVEHFVKPERMLV